MTPAQVVLGMYEWFQNNFASLAEQCKQLGELGEAPAIDPLVRQIEDGSFQGSECSRNRDDSVSDAGVDRDHEEKESFAGGSGATYEVGEILGQGSRATVKLCHLKARDLGDPRRPESRYAVRVYERAKEHERRSRRDGSCTPETAFDDVRRELEIMGTLQDGGSHPHVMPLCVPSLSPARHSHWAAVLHHA